MNANLESRILELLMTTPSRALPVREVHRVLTTEFGVRAGTLEQFHDRLRDGAGELLMVEPENPFGDVADWPPGIRNEYEVALREAGVDVGPWITAASPGQHADAGFAPALVHSSLLELWNTCHPGSGLRSALAKALADMRGNGTNPTPGSARERGTDGASTR